jgi:uncharacterized phiE125 gp8 family phage protein
MNTRIKTDLVQEPLNREELANYIKFQDDNAEEDLLIAGMISSVRAHFETRTGLSFAEKTYETFFSYNDKPFILPRSPVISVDKVELIDYQGTKSELVLNSGYYKRGLYEVEILTSEMAGWVNPLTSFGDYYDLLVTYKAGYGHADTENIPADLLEAMKKQIKQWYDNRDDFYEFNILGSIDKILNKHKTKVL